MAKSLQHTENILNMNTRLLLSALDGVTETQAKERNSYHNKPPSWLATTTILAT